MEKLKRSSVCSNEKWALAKIVVIFSLLLNFGGLLEQGDAGTGYGTLGSLVTGGVALGAWKSRGTIAYWENTLNYQFSVGSSTHVCK